MAPDLDFRNTNTLWCSVLAETLVRCGVRFVVCSPGSRSAPLTVALARQRGIEAIPVLDERSAGFVAIGLARGSGTPVALVCTSGSAAANYWPAVVEAQGSQVPLVVLTADRPPEMRGCTSGQTIDQAKLYGSYVLHFAELPLPEPRRELLATLRQTVAFAVARAKGPLPGPVHLNAPFRDPLPPIPDDTTRGLESQLKGSFFDAGEAPRFSAGHTLSLSGGRGVIVAGTHAPNDLEKWRRAVRAAHEATGWPVIADPLSPARSAADLGDALVTTYDSILRTPEVRAALRPDFVLLLGAWPTSKVLRAFIQEADPRGVVVALAAENRDALHSRFTHVLARPEELRVEFAGERDPPYQAVWAAAEKAAREAIDGALAAERALFEPKALWLIAQRVKPDTALFVANSMPVRDAEYVTPWRSHGARVVCNRGANGIDGNVSTALGFAHAEGSAWAVVGDLAFLHDSNALLSAPRLRGSLTLVVINNNGGGIFEHLPIASADAPFRDFFLTPQATDIGKLCAAQCVSHARIEDWQALENALATEPAVGLRVLEVRTDGRADAAARKALFARAGDVVRAALAGQSR